jgi:hypothetical protein
MFHCVARSSAQMNGRALGIYESSHEPPSKAAEERRQEPEPDDTVGVRLLGCVVPAVRTAEGVRALKRDFRSASVASVGRYLASKFGDHMAKARAAMERLAASIPPKELNRRAFALYKTLRPAVLAGVQ